MDLNDTNVKKNGNISYIDDNGDTYYNDNNGLPVHIVYADGTERWNTFDDRQRLSHYELSNGYSETFEYNDTGSVISATNSNGQKWTFDYAPNGKDVIHEITYDGIENWYTYNDTGLKTGIHVKKFNSRYNAIIEIWKDLNEKGQVYHQKNSMGNESWREYDANGNMVKYQNEAGVIELIEYDDNHNIISSKIIKNEQ